MQESPFYKIVEQRGIEKGIERGYNQGFIKGFEQGVKQGINKGARETSIKNTLSVLTEYVFHRAMCNLYRRHLNLL